MPEPNEQTRLHDYNCWLYVRNTPHHTTPPISDVLLSFCFIAIVRVDWQKTERARTRSEDGLIRERKTVFVFLWFVESIRLTICCCFPLFELCYWRVVFISTPVCGGRHWWTYRIFIVFIWHIVFHSIQQNMYVLFHSICTIHIWLWFCSLCNAIRLLTATLNIMRHTG